MQQSPQLLNGALTANITIEQSQKYLDENKELILAIMEIQNLGKFIERAQVILMLEYVERYSLMMCHSCWAVGIQAIGYCF
ncbi:GRF1-interacting factor 3-like [Alnus glutinosa]|uniref:GRF1-interacting factor 3-like n=1 Tax=Alnus glutinosa TaxID=3517 RepID=UPI002D79D4DA|nr:GRF1-interacting factor 3-like [Alnus glutinosa]